MNRIADWMGSPLVTAPTGGPLDEAARTLVDERIRHLPVVDGEGRVLGLLSDMGVFAEGNWLAGRWVQGREADVDGVMEPIRVFVRPADEVPFALAAMRAAQSDHALVLSDDDTPIGIFTEHDVARYGARHLCPTARLPAGRPLHCVPPDLPVARALGEMFRWDVRHLLVMRDRALIGLVSVRDLVVRPGDWTVLQAMPAGPLRQVGPNVSLRAASALMEKRKVGALAVVDGERPLGIVTRTDIARALLADHDRTQDVA